MTLPIISIVPVVLVYYLSAVTFNCLSHKTRPHKSAHAFHNLSIYIKYSAIASEGFDVEFIGGRHYYNIDNVWIVR